MELTNNSLAAPQPLLYTYDTSASNWFWLGSNPGEYCLTYFLTQVSADAASLANNCLASSSVIVCPDRTSGP